MNGRRNNQQDDALGWVLKYCNEFTPDDMESNNLRPLKQEQFGMLKPSDELLSAQIATFSGQHLETFKFVLMPNILLKITDKQAVLLPPQAQFQQQMSTACYLSLSECTIIQKMVNHKTQQAFSLILTNSIGSTFLFFQNFVAYRSWYKQLKQFCKLTGFLEKYKLGEKILPQFYQCTKKSKKTQYTVQIYKLDDFVQCKELEDAVHNEIQILRSIKHQSLLELKRVYEGPKYLFIVYEYYKGDSLFKLFNSQIQLHEVQIASIVYQILSAVKFLHQHQFYHGSINPQNILINTQHQMLQITLVNISFKEYKLNDKLDWILNRAMEQFLAPEIYDGIAPNISTDLYSVGCTLFFMSFYDPKQYDLQNDDKDFYNVMDTFEINPELINKAESRLQERMTSSGANNLRPNISTSQLDLLRKLLELNASSRMTIKEATKHHWFVNVKSKIKGLKLERKRKKPLPSLRTIIELREQSEMDNRLTIIQQQQSGINVLSSKMSLTPSQGKRTLVIYNQQQSKFGQYTAKPPSNSQFDPDEDEGINIIQIVPDEDLCLEIPIILFRKREPKRRPSNIRLIL